MGSVGSVQLQIVPCCSLHFLMSTGPFRCSRCHLQGFQSVAAVTSEVVPCVYLASVCLSLQCLISALTQAGGGGLLFRFPGSVVLWGGNGAADKCHWRVWGALAVFTPGLPPLTGAWGALTVVRPHWVCPRSRVCGEHLLSSDHTGFAPLTGAWGAPAVF